jgi:hypothetical protein
MAQGVVRKLMPPLKSWAVIAMAKVQLGPCCTTGVRWCTVSLQCATQTTCEAAIN